MKQADHVLAEADVLVRGDGVGEVATPVVAADDLRADGSTYQRSASTKSGTTMAMWSQPVS